VPAFDTSGSDKSDAYAVFATTRWSVVLAAQGGTSLEDEARAALEQLCRTYWRPLYAFIRRRGFSQHDAEDLTQGFLAHLLAQSFLAGVAPQKGKFRSFLLASLKNYLADQRDRASAVKRGANFSFVSLNLEQGTEPYLESSLENLTADMVFDRGWAMSLLEQARSRLETEYVAAHKRELYETLRRFNAMGNGEQSYAEVAGQLNLPENTLKSLVRRFRLRYRQLLREEVAQTVSSAAEVDDEIRYLLQAASV
jgi:RNA polymerase sigma factor (sigma-70 family)